VAVVEGGPDLLAAHHFLHLAGRHDVAVVALLGAGLRLRPDALRMLGGKRIRIFPHTDKEDARTGRRAGFTAAERWSAQIAEAGWGAEVDEFRLPLPPGQTGDLNDAARDASLSDAVLRAFAEF
jgi:hypothetical protein